MNNTLVFATGNAGKISEMMVLAQNSNITVSSPLDLVSQFGPVNDIPEIGTTYFENALIKATAYNNWCKLPVFADDSGLEVDALEGKPGLYTARFAGPNASDKENRSLMLKSLAGIKTRSARFRCILVAIIDQDVITSEGILEGSIAESECGGAGFGYDSIFIPTGETKTIAELKQLGVVVDTHRNRAFRKLEELINL